MGIPLVFCVLELMKFGHARTHIFDGLTVTKETAAFQLCDIHDEMLKEMIEDEEDLRETCNVCFAFSFSIGLPIHIHVTLEQGTRRLVLNTRIRENQDCSPIQILFLVGGSYRNTGGVRSAARSSRRI